MKYLTTQEGTANHINGIPNVGDNSLNWVFPFTKDGIHAMNIHINHFTKVKQLIDSNDASLYWFEADEPTYLPFIQTLNYIDLRNAKKVNKEAVNKIIKWFRDIDDNGYTINAWTEEQLEKQLLPNNPRFEQLSHSVSKERAVSWLSSIMVSLGPSVWINPACETAKGASCPDLQVVVVKPVDMYRVSNQKVNELFGDIADNPLFNGHGNDIDQFENENWWKSPKDIADDMQE